MLDRAAIALLRPVLTSAARGLVRLGLHADQVTLAGFAIGMAAAIAIATQHPFIGLAGTPAVLMDALDFTLTRGVMPAAMKQMIVTAVTNDGAGNLHRVQTGVYLTLTSSYYNVWH